MDVARVDKQPLPKAGRVLNWCTTTKNLAVAQLVRTGPKPPAQLLPEAQKAKTVPTVSVDYKWHGVTHQFYLPVTKQFKKQALRSFQQNKNISSVMKQL